MKRKEISRIVDEAGAYLDHIGNAELKHKDTGELCGSVTQEEIWGIQTGMAFVKHMLEGHYTPKDGMQLAVDVVLFHGAGTAEYKQGDNDAQPSTDQQDAGDDGDGEEG